MLSLSCAGAKTREQQQTAHSTSEINNRDRFVQRDGLQKLVFKGEYGERSSKADFMMSASTSELGLSHLPAQTQFEEICC
jgi:hypothetical protein